MGSVSRLRFDQAALLLLVAALAVGVLACGGSATSSPEVTSPADSEAPEQTEPVASPTADELACQVPTVKVSDAPADCFDGLGQAGECSGLDIVDVEAGLLTGLPDVADVPNLPTGFALTFADALAGREEFGLFLYLDLDQDPNTGLDMSSGPIALPGIDRIVGASLPAGEAWTQPVGNGGYDAEIVEDAELTSFRVVDDVAIVLVARALLVDASVFGRGEGSAVMVGRALAGAMPDAFTLYVGTARSIEALDYLNIEGDIQVPLTVTVPQDALYPPCPGGS